MSSTNQYTETIQQNWDNREYIEKVSQNILRITEFLNKFEFVTRTKLNELNQKLSVIERKMEYIDAAVDSVELAQKQNNSQNDQRVEAVEE
jgi:chromosome 3 open reading frame 10